MNDMVCASKSSRDQTNVLSFRDELTDGLPTLFTIVNGAVIDVHANKFPVGVVIDTTAPRLCEFKRFIRRIEGVFNAHFRVLRDIVHNLLAKVSAYDIAPSGMGQLVYGHSTTSPSQ